jgi:outer membrane lipoprotein SlyB
MMGQGRGNEPLCVLTTPTTVIGDAVGEAVGDLVGEAVGDLVGEAVGDLAGETVGDLVGETVGDLVGETVGDLVGETVGNLVGETVGAAAGDTVGEELCTQPDGQVLRLPKLSTAATLYRTKGSKASAVLESLNPQDFLR